MQHHGVPRRVVQDHANGLKAEVQQECHTRVVTVVVMLHGPYLWWT
jgi:hypothetical protein